ncbi:MULTISPECIES: class I SAM-dependent methyltransferase [unclassified Prochlorococcus]|nr:Methyltransferase type 11 [Prochlorococcus sp. MIT 0701]KGG31423.1 Methyltransferase type 11 [Prochlorococcus sp. MIT 0703]
MVVNHKPVFLHVGCGPKHQDRTPFADKDWQEIRLDIDESVRPNLVGTMTDLSAVENQSVDAIFSSHNIEHLYPHDVSIALGEFKRVLKIDGFILINCPDLQEVCKLIAEDKLTDPAYVSTSGPIAPIDILYGHRAAMQKGNLYMAHRCGFTKKVLQSTLTAAGFSSFVKKRSEHFDLWALGELRHEESRIRELAAEFIP